MLKYFVANLSLRVGMTEKAAALAQELLNSDLREYFGHM